MKTDTSRIYLDNATTTRIDPAVLEEMYEFEKRCWGVPAQIHTPGREARRALDASRERIARCLGVGEEEITFTSGATEANNLALFGAAQSLSHKRSGDRHIITSSVEHPSVLRACEALEKQGFEVTYLPVNSEGLVDPDGVARAIKDDTILISILLAEGETGAIQPVRDIANIAGARGITFHTDAAQAVGKIPVHPLDLGADLLSVSAHKFHGPKGIGVLYTRSGTRITPLLRGGPEQDTLRPGTVNVANCVGMAAALELASSRLEDDMPRVASLRDRFLEGVTSLGCPVRPNGPKDDKNRLPGSLCLLFEGLEAEALLMNLDSAGVYIGAGNACASGALDPSSVLLATGLSRLDALNSIRISLSRDTSLRDVELALERFGSVVCRLRSVPV